MSLNDTHIIGAMTEAEFALAQARARDNTVGGPTWRRSPLPDFTSQGVRFWTEETVQRWMRMQQVPWQSDEDVVERLLDYVLRSQAAAQKAAPTVSRRAWEIHERLTAAGIDLHHSHDVWRSACSSWA